jgi:phage terminase large subunit-like protein
MFNKSDKYISDILSGKVYHGKYVLQVVKNLENDKQVSNEWVFDYEVSNRYIRFIENLVFTEGAKKGQNISLENWQAFYISQIFGWVNKQDKSKRRFVETTLCVPRKNGKSTLIGIISLACAYLDDEPRGQVYMAATNQKQARLCFDSAWYSVKQTNGLSNRIIVSAHNLLVKKNNTFIRYISSEAGGIEGTNPSVAVLDEEHLAVDNKLREALRLGMGTRKNPLFRWVNN